MWLAVKNLLFTVLVPGTAAVLVPLAIVRRQSLAMGGGSRLGWLLVAAGLLVYAWCVWDFAVSGRGTPLPVDAPRKLVVRGLYRFTRNPMYLGVLGVILGWAVLYGSAMLALYLVFVGACFHLMAVLYEEPHLAKVFGPEYQDYRLRVGRWWPSLRPLGSDGGIRGGGGGARPPAGRSSAGAPTTPDVPDQRPERP